MKALVVLSIVVYLTLCVCVLVGGWLYLRARRERWEEFRAAQDRKASSFRDPTDFRNDADSGV